MIGDTLLALLGGGTASPPDVDRLRIELNRLQGLVLPTSRFIGARVYNSAAFSHNSSGSWLAVTFDAERFDTSAIHSTASNTSRLTCVVAGVYSIFGTVQFAVNATGWRGTRIYLNGATPIATVLHAASSNTYAILQTVSTIYELVAGDYIEIQAFQDSGGTLALSQQDNTSPEFGMALIGVLVPAT